MYKDYAISGFKIIHMRCIYLGNMFVCINSLLICLVVLLSHGIWWQPLFWSLRGLTPNKWLLLCSVFLSLFLSLFISLSLAFSLPVCFASVRQRSWNSIFRFPAWSRLVFWRHHFLKENLPQTVSLSHHPSVAVEILCEIETDRLCRGMGGIIAPLLHSD